MKRFFVNASQAMTWRTVANRSFKWNGSAFLMPRINGSLQKISTTTRSCGIVVARNYSFLTKICESQTWAWITIELGCYKHLSHKNRYPTTDMSSRQGMLRQNHICIYCTLRCLNRWLLSEKIRSTLSFCVQNCSAIYYTVVHTTLYQRWMWTSIQGWFIGDKITSFGC